MHAAGKRLTHRPVSGIGRAPAVRPGPGGCGRPAVYGAAKEPSTMAESTFIPAMRGMGRR